MTSRAGDGEEPEKETVAVWVCLIRLWALSLEMKQPAG